MGGDSSGRLLPGQAVKGSDARCRRLAHLPLRLPLGCGLPRCDGCSFRPPPRKRPWRAAATARWLSPDNTYPAGGAVRSGLVTDQFLVGHGIEDAELLGMQARVGPEGKLAKVALFHLDDEPFVLGPQPFEHLGVHDNA